MRYLIKDKLVRGNSGTFSPNYFFIFLKMETPLTKAVAFLSDVLEKHDFDASEQPLIVGVNGPQGSGKSYLCEHLLGEMSNKFPDLKFVQFLMDDLYLRHEEQSQLTAKCILEDNKLLQGRGLPGTHDIDLALEIFDKLNKREPVQIPFYDKSLFGGEGDRSPKDQWNTVNGKVDVLIFEGWFNGFLPIPNDNLRLKYLSSDVDYSVLKKHRLYHLEELNETLKQYQKIWSMFNYFIYIKTESVQDVYVWRLEQEHNLKKITGTGMTDDQVKEFIDRYMPVYELYYEKLCETGYIQEKGHNLELFIDIKRNLISSQIH